VGGVADPVREPVRGGGELHSGPCRGWSGWRWYVENVPRPDSTINVAFCDTDWCGVIVDAEPYDSSRELTSRFATWLCGETRGTLREW
jgi:hypothetical protein